MGEEAQGATGIALPGKERFPARIILLFALLSLGIVLLGYFYYSGLKTAHEQQMRDELIAIRDLKVHQIAAWRNERRADAQVIFEDRFVGERFAALAANPADPGLRRGLVSWMESRRRNYGFEAIFFLGANGTVVLESHNGGERVYDATRSLAREALKTRAVAAGDLFLDPATQDIDIDFASPVMRSDSASDRPIGVLILRLDPYQFLYPFIQTWPTSSRTAETLLVRRTDDSVVFLNELRHRKGTAMTLTFPIGRSDLPAARAVRGTTGIVVGQDYRGHDVVAAIGPVPDSPWYIVAKVDREEVFAEMTRRAVHVSVAVFLLILSAGLGLAAWLRQKDRMHLSSLYEAEKHRREASEKFELLSRHANDIILMLDLHGNIREANERALTSYGYAREELLDLNIRDIRAADERALLEQQLLSVEEQGSLIFEGHHRRKDGSTFAVEVSSRRVDAEGGGFLLSIIRDITERKLAEEKLLHANRLYAILSQINQTIVRVQDRQRLFHDICDIAVTLGGFRMAWIGIADEGNDLIDPAEVCGPSEGFFDAPVALHDTEADMGPTGAAVRDGAFAVCNDIARSPCMEAWRAAAMSNGHRSVGAFPVRVKGRTVGALTLYSGEEHFFDDAEIKLLNEVADDISFALEHLEQEAERSRLEAQLRQSQKMEAIGQLAGGVAHDFNNILSAIIGYAELLNRKVGERKDLQSDLNHILDAAERAAQLTRSLLAFSRKQIMNPTVVDLNGIIMSVQKLLDRIIGEDIELRTFLSEAPLAVKVDTGQMEQVLMNLCANARDAMPEGGLLAIETETVVMDEQYVTAHGYGAPGTYALTTVTDTGMGMDAKTLERIFEPFFTTKEVGKGTGLGLAMVYGIVRQHRGYLNVYSEPGKGTTFKIYLPITTDPVAAAAGPVPAPASIQGGQETVLLAEDDGALRKLCSSVLREFGYTVIEAEDGEAAVQRFREHAGSVQLLLLDIVMPKRNGKEVYEELRKAAPGVRAVFMSGYTANVIHKQGILDQGLDFLMKPVSPRELLAKVREVLDRPQP